MLSHVELHKFIGQKVISDKYGFTENQWIKRKSTPTSCGLAYMACINQMGIDKLESLIDNPAQFGLIWDYIRACGGVQKLSRETGIWDKLIYNWTSRKPATSPSYEDYSKIFDVMRENLQQLKKSPQTKMYRIVEVKESAPLYTHIFTRFEKLEDMELLMGVSRYVILNRKQEAKTGNKGRGKTMPYELQLLASDLNYWYETYLVNGIDEEDRKFYLKLTGLSLGEIAEELGISQPSLTNWHKGRCSGKNYEEKIVKLFKAGYESFKQEVLV